MPKSIPDRQIYILRTIADGALHNPLAYPLLDDAAPKLEFIADWFATACVVARGYATFADIDERNDRIWIRITAKGRAALNSGAHQ